MPPARIDMRLAAATMEKRCSRCHTLDRIAGARKDAAGWLATVNRMKALPDFRSFRGRFPDHRFLPCISNGAKRLGGGSWHGGRARWLISAAAVVTASTAFTGLRRLHRSGVSCQTNDGLFRRQQQCFFPGEDQKIIAYLSATQTPEAVNKRSAPVAESSTEQTPVIQGAGAHTTQAARLHHYDGVLIAFLSILCSGTLALIVRRLARSVPASSNSNMAVAVRLAGVARATSPPPQPIILRLVSVIQQTPDAKTLRFAVSDGGTLKARHGQFLTLSFLFDRKKITSSYSICSSTARSGYLEITPRRVNNGCVSVLLNDRAALVSSPWLK
jgi:hypothetical protein